jgi:ankyrin repeat protein
MSLQGGKKSKSRMRRSKQKRSIQRPQRPQRHRLGGGLINDRRYTVERKYKSIWEAIFDKNEQKAIEFLTDNLNPINVNEKDCRSGYSIQEHDLVYTLLEAAVRNNLINVVKELIARGANLDTNGGVALRAACQDGYTDIVRVLLEAKANVNVNFQGNLTPLANAIMFEHPIIVDLLIKAGADMNRLFSVTTKYQTPLIQAIRDRNLDIAKLLIEAGANVNKADANGKTPLYYASYYRDLKDIKELLQKKGARMELNYTDKDYWENIE